MSAMQFIKKPVFLIGGGLVALYLLAKNSSSPPQQSAQDAVNTELELAKIQANTATHISDNEASSALSNFNSTNNMQMFNATMAYQMAGLDAGVQTHLSDNTAKSTMFQSMTDYNIAGLNADVSKYALTTDLVKSLDTNKTMQSIALTDSNNQLASNLNAQNQEAAVSILQSTNDRLVSFHNADVMQTVSLADISANLQSALDSNSKNYYLGIDSNQKMLVTTLDNNATNRELGIAQINSNNYMAGLDQQSHSWDVVSNNYANLLSAGKGGVNQSSVSPKSAQTMSYVKGGIMAVGAIAAPFTGGASLAAATAATTAMSATGH